MRRYRENRRSGRRRFRHGAMRTHRYNLRGNPMRGGIRL